MIAFTRTGDANLDGVVNNDDVTVLGANFAPGASKPGWALGDFDYNGFVDNDDVTLLGAFFNPEIAPMEALPAPDSVKAPMTAIERRDLTAPPVPPVGKRRSPPMSPIRSLPETAISLRDVSTALKESAGPAN